MSRILKMHELEIARQATVISQQGHMIGRQEEVIGRLEALIISDRKYKTEAKETGNYKLFP